MKEVLLGVGLPAGILLFDSILTCRFVVPDRVKRFSKGLNRLLLLIPVLAVPVFAALFLFVLKDRLYERLSHALFLLALWLYAARYYWFLVSYYKYLTFHISVDIACSFFRFVLFGVGFVAMAIRFTPLDKYVDKIHSVQGSASIFAGAGLLLVFYVAALITMCVNKTEVSGGSWGIDR